MLILVLMGPESTESISNWFPKSLKRLHLTAGEDALCKFTYTVVPQFPDDRIFGEYLLKRYAVSSCKSDIIDGGSEARGLYQ